MRKSADSDAKKGALIDHLSKPPGASNEELIGHGSRASFPEGHSLTELEHGGSLGRVRDGAASWHSPAKTKDKTI